MDDETLEVVFGLLEEHFAAELLAETDIPTTLAIADDLNPQELSDLVEEMDPDDATDVLSELQEEEEKILGLMEDAEEVQELMAHEEDTGGGIKTPDFVLAHADTTVSVVIKTLREEAEDIFDLYVVNDKNQLQGVVPLHRLVTAQPQIQMSELMNRDDLSVSPETDQEDIAQMFTRYDLQSLPVVAENGELVGQITVDNVMDVIQEEATEDIFKMAETSDEERERTSVFGVYRARLP